ncbi:hypothetical protein BJY01DRAFT_209413, partial [Aspergillus pseudoustus]
MEHCKRRPDEDLEYIRPHPRAARACDPCRTRKIRCLRGEKGFNGDACRRCASYGYQCTYTPIRSRQPRDGGPLTKPKPVKFDNRKDEDVVSELCKGSPPRMGGLSHILDVHRRAFQDKLPQAGALYSSATSIPTPESIDQPLHSTCCSGVPEANLNIDMQEAEKLLSLFRQRNSYFPFIDIPDTTSAASMAVHRPFLLLAILTVASSRAPRLQQRTDERFRRVLGERVILHGEQSLDYVQGLLVYIAWLPLHLHPIRSQLFQYLRILNAMISDLELDSFLNDTTKEEKDTFLGCFSLTSHLSGLFQRVRKDNSTPESYIDSLRHLGPHLASNMSMQYARIHELAGRVTGYEPTSSIAKDICDRRAGCGQVQPLYQDKPSPCAGKLEVRKRVEEFNSELESLEVELSGEIQNKISIRLAMLFIKLSITFLPVKPAQPSKTRHKLEAPFISPPDYTDAEILDVANSCLADITTFLETFLATPLEEYLLFTIREWSQLIVTISLASHLCFTRPETDDNTGWDNFQTNSRAKMLIYLESLIHRMDTLSVSSSSTPFPDGFCMFKSVFGILVQTFAPPSTPDTSHCTRTTTMSESLASSEQCRNPSIKNPQLSGSAISRCPVMNGTLQQTDFWRALEQNTPSSNDSPTGGCSNQQSSSLLEGYTVDGLMEAPQDWPSIFSDWVVDLGSLP